MQHTLIPGPRTLQLMTCGQFGTTNSWRSSTSMLLSSVLLPSGSSYRPGRIGTSSSSPSARIGCIGSGGETRQTLRSTLHQSAPVRKLEMHTDRSETLTCTSRDNVQQTQESPRIFGVPLTKSPVETVPM